MDSLGDIIWEETYGGNYSDYGEQALFLSGGNDEIGFIGTSTVMKQSEFVTDLYFIKISSDGTELGGILTDLNNDIINYDNTYSVSIYPNPARDQFFIKTSGNISGDNTFKLFDVSGKLVKTTKVLANPFLVKLGAKLSPGIYLYQLESKGVVKTGRIVLNN